MSTPPENLALSAEELKDYALLVSEALMTRELEWPKTPLFEPVRYLVGLGGKRIRPVLVLAACSAENGNINKALPAALAVEIFHNFTLMHDDIMDMAPLRRGRATVHEKWDENTAILSGDAMFVQAYEELSLIDPLYLQPLLKLFNRTAIEVCEGQQQDMAFERVASADLEAYMEMIRLKTSVLLAAALQMGAMVAGASEQRQALYYRFGIELGLAFQLQDDLLDAFGDPETFGKQTGGDILADKKTYLYLFTLLNGSEDEVKALKEWNGHQGEPAEKVRAVKLLFEASGARDEVEKLIEKHADKAVMILKQLSLDQSKHQVLEALVQLAGKRSS